VIVRIVLWVGKASFYCRDWICGGGGGGGLALTLTWGLVLFCAGYVTCGTAIGYVIWGAGGGYVICGVGKG
jgi:hypothetical protein